MLRLSSFNIKVPFKIPDDAFLALELRKGALDGVKGIAEYTRPYFDTL